jgi:hypothetical protein
MAKASEPIVISKVLQKQAQGGAVTLKEGQAIAKAAGALRDRINNDIYKAMQNPAALEPGELECIAGLVTLLHEHGFISDSEMLNFQEGIRMLG